MGKYGQAALNAIVLLNSRKAVDPQDAWEKATAALFGKGTSSQKKSCPKDAFLGLCDSGLIKGMSSPNSTSSVDNKAYSVTAAQLLQANPGLSSLGTESMESCHAATKKTNEDHP